MICSRAGRSRIGLTRLFTSGELSALATWSVGALRANRPSATGSRTSSTVGTRIIGSTIALLRRTAVRSLRMTRRMAAQSRAPGREVGRTTVVRGVVAVVPPGGVVAVAVMPARGRA